MASTATIPHKIVKGLENQAGGNSHLLNGQYLYGWYQSGLPFAFVAKQKPQHKSTTTKSEADDQHETSTWIDDIGLSRGAANPVKPSQKIITVYCFYDMIGRLSLLMRPVAQCAPRYSDICVIILCLTRKP